jgi:hypothetical protein
MIMILVDFIQKVVKRLNFIMVERADMEVMALLKI